ncbi:tRNA modification GTPase [Maioricimonas sp. JC845]|uniref:tRNA modification GTPase n=1 Tax=Maioricimonas sp. JC845 TaxID=3232138 RepID=UPI00345A15CD
MDFHPDDTIAAIASAPGPGWHGIIRVSGPRMREIVDAVFRPADEAAWRERRQPWRHPGMVQLSSVATPMDGAVYLWPGPRSYTGEPMAEIHTISSPPLLEACLDDLFAAGARPAQRGEFTLRSFLNGRIDLLQAEAVLAVIDAPDQQHLESALSQLAGGISRRIAELREAMLIDLADLEAGLDFVEEDIDFVDRTEMVGRIRHARELLQRLLRDASDRMQSTGARRVVLAGLPNAGKSTLFNTLVAEQRALVSDQAGTTRDFVSAATTWEGQPVELIDTAGWEEADHPILQTAVRHGSDQVERADLVLWCSACGQPEDARAFDALRLAHVRQQGRPLVHVATKVDLAAPEDFEPDICVSTVDGRGLEDLIALACDRLQEDATGSGELLGTTAARCQESLRQAISGLQAAEELAIAAAGDELISMELRSALDGLGQIAGEVYTDDILDRIFSRFCIGK